MRDARSAIESRVRDAIERFGLLPAEGRIVVAVSGGPDSLCLLGILDALCGPGHEWSRVELIVAHLNHGLRAAAQDDADWVAALATELGYSCIVGTRDVAALARIERRGIEDAARRARYAFLREVAQEHDAAYICVGHTRDDQAETLILQWLRGSALTGLSGMRPLRDNIARPLLALRRAETQAYCALRGWTPRVDASNDDRRFLRNRVRHELLPILERFNPNLVSTLTRNAALLADDEAYMEQAAAGAWERIATTEDAHRVALDAARLAALNPALLRRVLRRAVRHVAIDAPVVEARHIALLERLARRDVGTVQLPGGASASMDGGTLLIRLGKSPEASERIRQTTASATAVPLPAPGCARLPGSEWQVRATLLDPAAGATPPGSEAIARGPEPAVRPLHPAAGTAADAGRAHLRAYVDADAAGGPLYVRAWRPGDHFRPLGMSGDKKVQDYFVDAKVPRAERTRIPLVWGPSHLVWIAGHRIDDRVKLTPQTQRVLALRLEPPAPASPSTKRRQRHS